MHTVRLLRLRLMFPRAELVLPRTFRRQLRSYCSRFDVCGAVCAVFFFCFLSFSPICCLPLSQTPATTAGARPQTETPLYKSFTACLRAWKLWIFMGAAAPGTTPTTDTAGRQGHAAKGAWANKAAQKRRMRWASCLGDAGDADQRTAHILRKRVY